jgi:hypothetical protein
MAPTMAPIANRPPMTPPTIAPVGAPDFSASLPEAISVDVGDPVPMPVEREERDVLVLGELDILDLCERRYLGAIEIHYLVPPSTRKTSIDSKRTLFREES